MELVSRRTGKALTPTCLGDEVTPESLCEAGLAKRRHPVKVLARGELTKKLSVKAHGFSAAAREAIEKAGGTVEWIGGEPKPKAPPETMTKAAPKAKEDKPKAEEAEGKQKKTPKAEKEEGKEEETPKDKEEAPKEDDAPAADAAEEGSDDEGSDGEDASD